MLACLLKHILATSCCLAAGDALAVDSPPELRVGRASHAFDHLGGIGNQAEAAAASGATIIYATGVGGVGYSGLPPEKELAAQCESIRAYNRNAKEHGIELSIGYLCATSIVGLESFDKNWLEEFRARFAKPPAEWRQIDRQGKFLPSWYGGDYAPACMNNPDWRAYQEFMVRQQLETGHDGIFFDNPTVHPAGCYCAHCMEQFAESLPKDETDEPLPVGDHPDRIEALRQLADAMPQQFLRFRATIARDFLAHMRSFARTVDAAALVTCNNSLNSPDRLYAQCRAHAYHIGEMSRAEDFVVVEDMFTQPLTLADGRTVEYGPTYKQLHAISHGKPIVATTLANADYHTPPHLVRLAMAEAAANRASYLSWPTWPEDQRSRMIAVIRPQADWLRQNENLLNDTRFRADVVLFLPYRRWTDTEQCTASSLASAMTRANLQYEVMSEDDFELSDRNGRLPVLVVESLSVLTPTETAAVEAFQTAGGHVVAADTNDWLTKVSQAVGRPSIALQGTATVRAVVHDQPLRTIVHLLNLDVERLSSFEDRVSPATDIRLTVRVPFNNVQGARILTADQGGTSGAAKFSTQPDGDGTLLQTTIPRLDISAMVVIEAEESRPRSIR
jgi:hypothetical protein